MCYLLPRGTVSAPYAVSLVSERCHAPLNVLKVVSNQLDKPPDVDFAVCVTPLNLQYDNAHRLVEFIEVRMRHSDQLSLPSLRGR